MERVANFLLAGLAGTVLLVLYAPLAIGALFSVVEVRRGAVDWGSATLAWYGRLADNPSILDALRSTLLVGTAAVAAATVLAIALALYVEWEGVLARRFVELVVYLPFLLPPIVTGLALLVAFVEVGLGRGLVTVAIGHAVFVLALLYRLVLTRLRSLPRSLVEASADLGASRLQTLRHVLWPHLRSAVATGAVLAFALSFDETLISVFLAGDSATLPLRLWAMMRVGFTPEINALVTLVLLVSLALAVIAAPHLLPREGTEG